MGVDVVVPVVALLSLTFVAIGMTKIISDGRTRRKLLDAGATPELARAVMASPQGDPSLYASLKWGLVMGSVGLALTVLQFLPYRSDEPIVYGLVLVFAAAGLLLYYVVGRKMSAKTEQTLT